jgi:hypothetical protein
VAEADSDGEVNVTHRIEALIDGRSQLVFQADTVKWLHYDWAAPGLHDGANAPTIINGTQWTPVWPDTGDPVLEFCECESEPTTGIELSIPQSNVTVDINPVEARGLICVAEAPSEAHGWALIIEFDDNMISGSTTYQIDMNVTASPDTGTSVGDWDCATRRQAEESQET